VAANSSIESKNLIVLRNLNLSLEIPNIYLFIYFLSGICPKSQYKCDDNCIDKALPCKGVCQDPHYISCDGTCISKEDTWDCDGECKNIEEPCNGVCHDQDDIVCNGTCISEEDTWDCDGECKYNWLPCNGVCHNQNDTFCDGMCVPKERYWNCDGECKYNWQPCNGACADQEKWECSGQCVDIHIPCNGVCREGYNLCGGECFPKEKQWDCNGECQSLYYPCNGMCPTLGNVSHIQESYLKCPKYELCFLLTEMCNASKKIRKGSTICFGDIYFSNKLCDRFPHTDKIVGCDEAMCKKAKQCIEENKICNGVIDCIDRSDESLCPENTISNIDFSIFTECENKYQQKGFKCGNACISYANWCKNYNSEKILKDLKITESDCPMLLKTLNNEKLCQNFTFWKNRTCKIFQTRFTGNYPGECAQFEDEFVNKYWQTDGSLRKCNDNKTSIHEELWCDGYMQCPDGSDEDPEECGKCPRTFGYPKDYKHATFSCKHKYTGRPICAVPCDGKDDLCLDDIDEQCSSASVQSTLLFGILLVILSVISGELYIFYIKKSKSNKKEGFQLNILKENSLLCILECCSDGHANLKKTFAYFKKSHCSEKYTEECATLSYTLGLINRENAQEIAKLFYNLECTFHKGNIDSVHTCIKNTFATNENTKLLFALISQPPLKTQFFKKLRHQSVLNVFKTQFSAGFFFLLLVTAKLFAYYADVYKDIYIIVEYSKLLTVDFMNLHSFGFQVFMLLIISVTLPASVNLFSLHQANTKRSNWKSRFIDFGVLILSPLVPALAVYVSSKLNLVTKRIKTFHQTNKKLNKKNSSESIKTILQNDHLMQQSSTILSDLKANENATEQFIQSLVLIMIIALKFTKSGTVSGFQELLAGNSDLFLLVLSAVWSVFSIIFGFVQNKSVQKHHSMPFSGKAIQFSYATLAMICRISACVIFFTPAIGLFNLLGHWKMGNFKFYFRKTYRLDAGIFLIIDVTDNGTLIYAKDVWKQINNYEELTVYQLDVYYIVFLLIIFFHFFLVAAIKLTCSKEFKSRKDYLKKMLHILHQGNTSNFSAQNMLYNAFHKLTVILINR
jgi:hypothetical protein